MGISSTYIRNRFGTLVVVFYKVKNYMKKFLFKLVPVFSLIMFLPLISLAQPKDRQASIFCDFATGGKLGDLFAYLTCLIQRSIIPLIFAIAIAMFVWGAVNFFIISSGEEKKRQEGKQFMIWGIVALTVMIGVWGLVAILGGTFGLNTTVLPSVQPSNK